ncbi:MAG TPA: hypothetical protein VMK84_25780 [Streptosporangiaceae bacterium]|nr:hypothetical protein [Streptosporangiaceae bacterium]
MCLVDGQQRDAAALVMFGGEQGGGLGGMSLTETATGPYVCPRSLKMTM